MRRLSYLLAGLFLCCGFTAPGPILDLTPVDGTIVHQSESVVAVSLLATDPSGLRSVTLSGAYQAGTVNAAGATSASEKISWFVRYYPVGDYTFTGTATNLAGQKSSQSVTLHLVK